MIKNNGFSRRNRCLVPVKIGRDIFIATIHRLLVYCKLSKIVTPSRGRPVE